MIYEQDDTFDRKLNCVEKYGIVRLCKPPILSIPSPTKQTHAFFFFFFGTDFLQSERKHGQSMEGHL